MALTTATTLNGAIAFDATKLVLTSGTGVTAGMLGVLNGEYITVVDATLTPTFTVTRGQQGTAGLAHATLSPVVFGLPSDFTFPGALAGQVPLIMSISVNDTNVTLPTRDALVFLQKATALAITINGPRADQQNIVKFISGTAAAHVITYTAGFSGNTTLSDTATFAATVNASVTLQARGGTWGAIAAVGVTIA